MNEQCELKDKGDLVRELQASVAALGSQAKWAKHHGFSRAYVCDVLSGRRDVSEAMAAKLGYERVPLFQKKIRITCADVLQNPDEVRELPELGFYAQTVNGPVYTSWPLDETPPSALYEAVQECPTPAADAMAEKLREGWTE